MASCDLEAATVSIADEEIGGKEQTGCMTPS